MLRSSSPLPIFRLSVTLPPTYMNWTSSPVDLVSSGTALAFSFLTPSKRNSQLGTICCGPFRRIGPRLSFTLHSMDPLVPSLCCHAPVPCVLISSISSLARPHCSTTSIRSPSHLNPVVLLPLILALSVCLVPLHGRYPLSSSDGNENLDRQTRFDRDIVGH